MMFLALHPGTSWGDNFSVYGCTARSISMGGAMVAVGGDVSNTFYNPAGMTGADDFLFSIGYSYADPTLNVDGQDTDVDTQSGIVIGAVFPTEFLGVKIAGGLLIYVPDKRVARYLLLPKEKPRFIMYANNAQRMSVLMPMAVEVFPWLSVGAGFSLLVDLSGVEEIYVSEVIEGEPVSPSVGRHTSDFKPTFAPYGGILLNYNKKVYLGISYAASSSSRIEVTPVVYLPDIYVYPDMPVPLIRGTRIDAAGSEASHFTPAELHAGLSLKLPRLTLAVSLIWSRWSEFKEYAPEVHLLLSGFPPGTPGHLGDWIEIFEFPIPEPDFRDILIPAVGVEYKALVTRHVDLDLRAGYYFRPTPVPDQVGLTNFMDSDVHAPAVGVGVTFKDLFRIITKPLSLDAYFQYQILTSRQTWKELPTNPVGDYESDGHILNVGGTLTVRF